MENTFVQASLLDAVPSPPSPFTSVETFFSFVRAVTAWNEDARIMSDLSTSSILQDNIALTVCSMREIKDGEAVSVFFFGKKAFEASIIKRTGALRLSLNDKAPSKAMMGCLINEKKRTIELNVLSSVPVVEEWLLGLKASVFRKLAADAIGCCDRFIQCSDALSCVCPRKLFSVNCLYRDNLENGRVFYGKNKTISYDEDQSSPMENTSRHAVTSDDADRPPQRRNDEVKKMNAFCTLDVELANSSDKGSICSIGIVTVENEKIVDTFYSLVRPKAEFSPMCMSIHHITPKDVADAPTFGELWPALWQRLSGRTIIAYRAETDIYALEKALYDADIDIPPIRYACALRMAKALLTLDSYKLSSVCDHFGIRIENAHNALDDAKATARVVIEYLKMTAATSLTGLMRACCLPYEYTDTNNYDPVHNVCGQTTGYIPPRVLPHKENQFFLGKSVVLTGTFVTAPKESVRITVESMGGICKGAPSRKTDIVLFGFYDKDTLCEGKSIGNKLQKAYDLVAAGCDIQIIDENEFFEILQMDPT